jgi:hypothetical protein
LFQGAGRGVRAVDPASFDSAAVGLENALIAFCAFPCDGARPATEAKRRQSDAEEYARDTVIEL